MASSHKKRFFSTAVIILAVLTISLIFSISATIGTDLICDIFINGNNEHYYVAEGRGASMEPYAHTGEYLVIMKSTHPGFTVDIGDVIVYLQHNDTTNIYYSVGHRVVSIDYSDLSLIYNTRGDNTDYIEQVPGLSVTGKIYRVISQNEFATASMIKWLI